MIVLREKYSATAEQLEQALLTAGWDPANPPLWVNWTGAVVQAPGLVLNGGSITNKVKQLQALTRAKIPVPEYRLAKPTTLLRDWLPRRAFHQQGRDFRKPPKRPDFWTLFTPVESEWRLHYFRGRSGKVYHIRSAVKVPKAGFRAHPTIRSHSLGWKLSYTGGAPLNLVETGRDCIEALKLDFGAVDLGAKADGSPLVFEVNTCPGLEGGTLAIYLKHIQKRGRA